MFRLRNLVWLLGLALLVGTAAGASWVLQHGEDNGGGRGGTTPPEPASRGIVAQGYVDVEPRIARLYPQVPGEVVWLAEEGKEVHKGDPVLRLDDRLAVADLERARTDVESAALQLKKAELLPKLHAIKREQLTAALEAAKQDRTAAENTRQFKQKLFDDKALNNFEPLIAAALVKKADALVRATESRLRELDVDDPQLEIDRARAEVAEKKALVRKAELALEKYVVKAPLDGTVLRVLTAVGESLGGNPQSPALQFCPKGKRLIRAEVLQEWAAKVAPGQEATIEDDTTAPQQWKGKVVSVSDWFTQKRNPVHEPFQYNDVRTLECLVEVTGPSGPPLRIGQRVRVTIKQGGP